MPDRNRTAWLGSYALIALTSAGLHAQNLLANPTFDSGASTWSNPFAIARVTWIGTDGNASGSGPGCLELGSRLNNGASVAADSPEIPVTPVTTYVLSGFARNPATSKGGAGAQLWVEWRSATHLRLRECRGLRLLRSRRALDRLFAQRGAAAWRRLRGGASGRADGVERQRGIDRPLG